VSARTDLAQLLESYTGIEIKRGGLDANLDAFLARRLPELRAASLEEYLARLAPHSAELELLLNAITVPHTWFMRDPGQLAIVSELLGRRPMLAPPLRVWVPGCATGEDVYSIAILAEQAGRRVEILGTDINSMALEHARVGRYGSWTVRELPDVDRYFERGERSTFLIAARFKEVVRFERHNLVDRPARGDWDVVLCRNVLIYIARERARSIVESLADALLPGGHLLLGASEVVFEVPPQLHAVYIAGRLSLRRNQNGDRRASQSESSRSLVPHAPRERWQAPLPALPRSAVDITEHPPAAPPQNLLGTAALLLRGHAQLDRSDLTAAITEYELAVDSDATLAEPHLYLGIALYLDGSLEKALHELRAAAFLDSALWPAMFYSAVCYEALGQLEAATREYRHVVRVAARSPGASLPRRHSAWHEDLIQLARTRASTGDRGA
jgi:chemotaxis methyl-accepting protein methylase